MISPLGWDSAFFGMSLARVTSRSLDAEGAREAVELARSGGVACLSLLLPAHDATSIAVAEDAGFRLVDVRLTLERRAGEPLPPRPPRPLVRPYAPPDLPALEAIAAEAHLNTRFGRDPRFPRERVMELYRTWIRKDCEGAAEVLVAEVDRAPVGYVTAGGIGERTGNIGLLAVRRDVRGGGTGTALVVTALARLSSPAVERVSVVTQGQELAPQRLYQRTGFLPVSVELWFHLWLT